MRNFGVVEGNKPVSDNDWSTVVRGGPAAIERWIAGQMNGTSCTIVLIGEATAGRRWINYEIEKAWNDGKGLVGIHIHNLKDHDGYQANRGSNPFATFSLTESQTPLSSIVRTYNPPYISSKDVYDYIGANLGQWVEEAIAIRSRY